MDIQADKRCLIDRYPGLIIAGPMLTIGLLLLLSLVLIP